MRKNIRGLFGVIFLIIVSVFSTVVTSKKLFRRASIHGISSEVHKTTKDASGQVSAVASSSVTTSASHDDSGIQFLTLQIPPEALMVNSPSVTGGAIGHSALAMESIAGVSSGSAVLLEPPKPFVRPFGPLPIPPSRFGFDEPSPFGPNSIPNCGCVSRGACLGDAGAYTELVLAYTDIVCGGTFQTCCFDGPWPGTPDSFAVAAACIPREQCPRPYGVLPTDVRDYGTIAPCPGQGVVRCLMVDEATLQEFQAAVAVIDAANAAQHQASIRPVQLIVPILGGGQDGETTVEAIATASVSGTDDDVEKHSIADHDEIPTPINIQIPLAPAPSEPAAVAPAVTNPVTVQTYVDKPSPIPVATPAVPAPVVPPSSVIIHNYYERPPPPVATPIPVKPPPAKPSVPWIVQNFNENPSNQAPPPPVAAAPPPPVPSHSGVGYQPIPGYGRFPFYPGFGFGKGFRFHKRIGFSKGFGYGLLG